MPETKTIRLVNAAREFNVSTATIVEHLQAKGFDVQSRPTTKLSEEMYGVLLKEFHKDKGMKAQADQISIGSKKREEVALDETAAPLPPKKEDKETIFVQSNLAEPAGSRKDDDDDEAPAEPAKPAARKAEAPAKPEAAPEVPAPKAGLSGPKVVGKVDLETASGKKPAAKKAEKPAEAPPKPAEPAKPEVKKEEAPAVAESPAAKPSPGAPAEEPARKAPEPVASVDPQTAKAEAADDNVIKTEKVTLDGPKIVGKIELPVDKPRDADSRRGKRKRIQRTDRPAARPGTPGAGGPGRGPAGPGKPGAPARGGRRGPTELSEKEIREQIKNTMAKLSGGGAKGKSSRAKLRKAKRDDHAERADMAAAAQDDSKLSVTEFISVAELASLMDVTPTQVISVCMGLGIIVSINQRLDAEVIELVGNEFGYEVEFIDPTASGEAEEEEEEDDPDTLVERAPIVTIMGHVDHGKTSLLDYIRRANVVAGEKGGITQHIGAYEVSTDGGKKIAFLDTPGHEAFTAMRARGAKVTDIAVIIIAADDAVMPQTKEAISHAQAAGVPMIFAINKVDKPGANPEKIKEQLSGMNILVEDWGGKFQVQHISAKTGEGVSELLEKILLEAELLELQANPDKPAIGSIVEASLDKGRGYVSNIMVQEGTLRIGDMVVAGSHFGKVKAMFNERGKAVKEAGPSTPLLLLGLNGAPQAGERFRVFENEQEAKDLANRRAQIQREQGIRAQKHLTLDEIGRRLAIGSFKELNLIIRGDVDGSVEALTDSLLKLATEEIAVNVVHKGVGQITESDVLLATASDAIIIGFQVRPSLTARKLAEKEAVEIRTYSIIYDAIEEIKAAMEGMLDAKIEEKIVANVEVRETFKISKVGTIAGCYVLDGKITRNTKVRLVRDGIVVHTGSLASLKRFKDDAKEVTAGMECGLNLDGYNDVKVGDIIEGYELVEVKRKLS
jgi:translation initiation factor IF-2